MNFVTWPEWLKNGWEMFEMEMLRRDKVYLISYVGDSLKIEESIRVSRKREYEHIGERLIISSRLEEYDKEELLYFLLVYTAEDIDKTLTDCT